MQTIPWWPLLAASLHIWEEFIFPGGFAEWDRNYRPDYRTSITPRFHLFINPLLIFACVAAGSAGSTPAGVAGWLTLTALLASNALFHLVGSVRTRSYSPGIVTGLLLYVPMTIFGYVHFLKSGQATAGTALAAAAIGGSYHLWSAWAHVRRARRTAVPLAFIGLAIALVIQPSSTPAASAPERDAAVIETFLRWAVEGGELPADPPRSAQALPHRSCGGRLDPQHLPETVYVSWQLSAEGQHAACNWKYDVASHHASPLTPADAAEAAQRISAGAIPPEARAFFHSVPQRDGRLTVTGGYCWGSATGTFAFAATGPVLTGELTIHGY